MPGFLVKALGLGHSWMWTHCSEPLVHNSRSQRFWPRQRACSWLVWWRRLIIRGAGPTIFFLVSAASFPVGGGFAHMLHFNLTKPVATRLRAALPHSGDRACGLRCGMLSM